MNVIIAGDIGGTHTRLAAYDCTPQSLECINLANYSSHDFSQFDELLAFFLHESKIDSVACMVLAVAGPVLNGQCRTTNLPWELDAGMLASSFGIKIVRLLNDIEAAGHGLMNLPKKELVQINPHAQFQDAHRAVISLGTGLGEAFLYWNGQDYLPNPSEGGHEDFAPMQEEDLPLWKFLHKRFPDHVSYERILSGPGIEMLYLYCCERAQVKHLGTKQDLASYVTKMAIQGDNPLCVQAMQIFIRILASEAANLCLKVMATGGIYLTGGIAPKIEPLLRQPAFLDAFIKKGRFKHIMSHVPIWVCRNDQVPMIGARELARESVLV